MTVTLYKAPAEAIDQVVLTGLALTAPPAVLVAARGMAAGGQAAFFALSRLVGGVATVRLAGGTDGEEYLVTCSAELEDGETLTEQLDVFILDGGWVMPDGSAGYVSIQDFVETYGLAEVVLMTSAGDGRIDRAMLINALRAAQGDADLNLSARYAVPIATVPDVVKLAICDIARARLYPRGAPDGVATAAKDAQRKLERIAAGIVPLPLAPGAVQAASDEDPVMMRPGRRQLSCRWGE